MPGGIVMMQQQGLQLESKATAGTMGWSVSTHSFYSREQPYEIAREKCLYFLLKPPDVLLEAECRCRGRGRCVLALEMLPLAVVQGQQ